MTTTPTAKPTVSETSLDQRQRIIALTQQGASATVIAQQVGCSPRTVTRWRARHRQAGDAGLAYRSRRPHTPHPQTTEASLVARIQAIRQAHPGWGARLIHRQLRLDGTPDVPSERTIHAWLGRLGFGRVRPLPSKPLGWQTPAPSPHETVWEVDFTKKGAPTT
jgi:transposase